MFALNNISKYISELGSHHTKKKVILLLVWNVSKVTACQAVNKFLNFDIVMYSRSDNVFWAKQRHTSNVFNLYNVDRKFDDDSLQDILRKGPIKVSAIIFPPLVIGDKNENIFGIDVEMWNAVGQSIRVNV